MSVKNLGLPKFVNGIIEGVRKNAPTIMSVGAVVGLGATVYLAVKAKPKADDILAKRKEELEEIKENEEQTEEEKKREIRNINIGAVTEMAKVIAPAAGAFIATAGLILGANHINLKRLSYIGGMYTISQTELKKYKEKAKEIVGERKEGEIREAVARDFVADTYTDDVTVFQTGKGDLLYLDEWSGRYFRSSKAAIESAFAKVTELTYGDMFCSLNELYSLLGLEETRFGNDCGFTPDQGFRMPDYSYTEAPNGEHAIVVHYDIDMRHRWGGYGTI